MPCLETPRRCAKPTRSRSQTRLRPLLEAGIVPIVTGFNGATEDGRPTTLGRGGSDFSASIFSAALDAEELWIWTDVDGIMTADPRLVADAAVLDEVTYAEAAELAYNGAKVLHPRTLAPLAEKRIPVWSKNSFAPEKPGTRIITHVDEPEASERSRRCRMWRSSRWNRRAQCSVVRASWPGHSMRWLLRTSKSWYSAVPATGRAFAS